jgi:formimidoylglutamate deiminase
MARYFAETALLPGGWARNVRLDVADDGLLAAVTPDADAAGAMRLAGPVLPGLPNLHSHAFQRAMAGMAETAGPTEDSFWTWRQTMYGFVERLMPDDLQAIAAQLYVEMLKAGYTAVAEFHYVHHAPDGRPFDDLAEMSGRIAAAATDAGIGVTLLPVLYAHGGFGGAPAKPGQRRFLNDGDRFLDLVDRLGRLVGPAGRVGIAPHSLRAVTPDLLQAVLDGFNARSADGPIHIHIAEQTAEVDECIAWSGRRPVEWLLEHAAVDRRWCLVHATHMTDDETRRMAASGAIAGLCPTTEANLGDGLFPAETYLAAGGAFGIGSDSHISVDAAEELRWLEYGQRLIRRRRNLLAEAPGRSTGRRLLDGALAGGAQACGRPIGALSAGKRADFVVLDGTAPALVGRSGDGIADAWIFANAGATVRDVFVGGRQVVAEGHHAHEPRIQARYRRALMNLTG